jgi:hypothetical protein
MSVYDVFFTCNQIRVSVSMALQERSGSGCGRLLPVTTHAVFEICSWKQPAIISR